MGQDASIFLLPESRILPVTDSALELCWNETTWSCLANNRQGKGLPLCQARRNVQEGAMANHSLGDKRFFHHNCPALLGWKNFGGRSTKTRPLGFMVMQKGGSGHGLLPATYRWGGGVSGVYVLSRAGICPQLVSQQYFIGHYLICDDHHDR